MKTFLLARGVNCRKIAHIVWGFCIGLILATVLSQFNHTYYLIDVQNVYYRQELFWISQVTPIISTIPLFLVLIHNQRLLVNTQLVSFEKELVHIKDYLVLAKMRFSEELNIQWDLQYQDFMLPLLTEMSLIENAIRHGLNKKTGDGTLTIKGAYR